MSITLYFNNQKNEIVGHPTLFECADSFGIKVPTSCIKQGRCKECIVEVSEGMALLSERTEKESHLKDSYRLSCQTKIVGSSGIVRCHTMRRGNMKIERQAMHLPTSNSKIIPDACVIKKGKSVLLDNEEIDQTDGSIYGIAVDLGTTTIVVRLLNLESGEIVADASFENPQRFGGSDVMARIQYDTDHRGRLLQRTLIGYLSHTIEEFPVDPMSIYEMVIAGNSTMRDIFFGLSVYSIGQTPYQSLTELEVIEGKRSTTSLTVTAKKLRIPIHPKARIYGLPIISGHVGADAAACMLAVDIMNEDRMIAVMDIGTNTELILGNKHKIMSASCPAGPAFEGGKISHGMPGLTGAIEKISIDKNGQMDYTVIDDSAAEGICGSGLIDLLSELLRTERMNALGRFENGDDSIVVNPKEERTISLFESDINELAQAKGANVAGLHILFKNYGIHFDELDTFYLAGGFGRHLNIESSKRIGLIPNIDTSKIFQVGNASIEGASIALLSRSKRVALEELVKRTIHCRLETDPKFFDYFVEGCQFYPVDAVHEKSEE